MTEPPVHAPRPPGLALERTTLAWTRTALVLSVVALLFLRFRSDGVLVIVSALAGVAAAWVFGLVMWLRHPARTRLLRAGTVRPERDAARLASAFVVVLAAGGLLLLFLGD